MNRAAEISANLLQVRERMRRACDQVARNPEEITLIAVTKTFPSSDISILADLGIADVGESKEQEGGRKVQELEALPLRWHFIGQLQRNKAARVAKWADLVHSVDRPELIPLLGSCEILIQVNLDQRGDRGGVAPARLMDLAQQIEDSPLSLRGLMAVAPLDADPIPAFSMLHQLHQQLLARYPRATILSAGMSGDLEAAIAHGATHLRIGSSILGSR